MKYLKIFEDFERGGSYPLPEKQCRYVKDNYPWINDPTYIKTDGSSYFLGDDAYDTLEEAINNMIGHFNIKHYTINNGTVDVMSDNWSYNYVSLKGRGLTKIPFNFGTINVGFDISNNRINTLDGAPKK